MRRRRRRSRAWIACGGGGVRDATRAGVREAAPDFDAALVARAADGGDDARHRLVPHRRRRDGALAGVSARRVAFVDVPGALPGFRDFYPEELAERAYIMRDVARRRAAVRVRRVRRTAARAARALHEEERRRDRRPALQLRRQGRSRGRAASGDDADARAHGGRARERAAQAGALVLDAAALPLRAPAEGPAARALPAQRRHHRRSGRHRRRRAAGVRHRHHARVRAHARATSSCASPTGGCCRRCLRGARRAGGRRAAASTA